MQSEKEFQKKDFESGNHSKVQNSFKLFLSLFTVTVIIVCRSFEPPFYRQPPIWPSPLFIFFPNTPFLARPFRQYRPNEIPDKHENKIMGQSHFFIFRRLKNNVKCLFYKKYLYKQHQAEI